MKKFLLIVAFVLHWQFTMAQAEADKQSEEEFKISLEFRPRFELRNGYRQLPNDTTKAAFFTSQRSRLYLSYVRPGFIFHTSIQDIRVWGEDDPRSTNGSLQVFEAYVEPTLTDNFSVRIGRQKIMYDNQRLFAQNDWRQNGGSHDAVRFIFKGQGLQTELVGAFNQSSERNFETDYSPDFSFYKILIVHYLKFEVSNYSFTTLNVADAYQDEVNKRENNFRYTHGGRVEYGKNNLYLTFSGYYQHGKTPEGQDLSAFYLQPEIKYAPTEKATIRLGAEVFSGDDATKQNTTSHSFDALYGVNHRFLGTMDYFTRFPDDFNDAGLIDPYLFFLYDFNEKFSGRVDGHLFYSENNFVVNDQIINKYLGFENDWILGYTPNDYTSVNFGFSWMLPEKSMEIIKDGGNSGKIPYGSYLMITFKPDLFKWTGRRNN